MNAVPTGEMRNLGTNILGKPNGRDNVVDFNKHFRIMRS
jgi:hypothetical protein